MSKPCSESVLILALYQNNKKEIVLPFVRAEHKKGSKWRIPGGGVKIGEFPSEATSRELKEEVGLTLISSFETAKVIKRQRETNFKEHWQYLFVGELSSIDGFFKHILDGKEFLTNELFLLEEVKAACLTNGHLLGYQILPEHRKLLNIAFKKIFS